MKRGMFIGRFQPFHLGHLSVIQEMDKAKDLEELVLGIGTAQIGNTAYNPFTAEEREDMIRRSVKLKKPYHIVKINDINDYPRWVSHVKSLSPEFNVVYAGNTIVKQLFEEKGYEVRNVDINYKISATEIRQLMIGNGNWIDYVPEGTRDFIVEIDGVRRLREISGKHMNPAVTVDVIIDYKEEGIVLIKRKNEPFKDFWALPGGFLDVGQEAVETAAAREAKEETSLDIRVEDLNLFGVYSKPGRDPRGPTVSVVYSAKVDKGDLKGNDDALEARAFKEIPEKLAFDHHKVLGDYYEKSNH